MANNPSIEHLDNINIYLGDPFEILYCYASNYDHLELQKEYSGTWNTIVTSNNNNYNITDGTFKISEIIHSTDNGNYRIIVYSKPGAELQFVTSNEFKVTTSAPPNAVVSKVTLWARNQSYSTLEEDSNGNYVINNLSRFVNFYTFNISIIYDDHGVNNSDTITFPYIYKLAVAEIQNGNANKVTGDNECDYGSESVKLTFGNIPANVTSTKISFLLQMSDSAIIEKFITINFAPV